ncbi:MAG: hypothetical protein NVS3B5_16500 [Sphingomicrobium sp.]
MRKKATRLAQQPTVNFYELAGLLVKLQDENAIHDLPAETGMSRRRLYYLLEVGRFIKDWNVSQAEAEKVRWTKLQIIARHVNPGATGKEVAKYMEMAKKPTTKAYALAEALASGVVTTKVTAMFRLTAEAKAELTEALTAFGAEHARTGLSNKEQALTLMVRAAMRGRLRLRTPKT